MSVTDLGSLTRASENLSLDLTIQLFANSASWELNHWWTFSSLNGSRWTFVGVAVAAAATAGSESRNDMSLRKTGAQKWFDKSSKDEMKARVEMNGMEFSGKEGL